MRLVSNCSGFMSVSKGKHIQERDGKKIHTPNYFQSRKIYVWSFPRHSYIIALQSQSVVRNFTLSAEWRQAQLDWKLNWKVHHESPFGWMKNSWFIGLPVKFGFSGDFACGANRCWGVLVPSFYSPFSAVSTAVAGISGLWNILLVVFLSSSANPNRAATSRRLILATHSSL